jgi:hypothetical protein
MTVDVGKANSVGVADGGNQTMVGEGGGVTVGRGVSVAGIESTGRQDASRRDPMKRNRANDRCIMMEKNLQGVVKYMRIKFYR